MEEPPGSAQPAVGQLDTDLGETWSGSWFPELTEVKREGLILLGVYKKTSPGKEPVLVDLVS